MAQLHDVAIVDERALAVGVLGSYDQDIGSILFRGVSDQIKEDKATVNDAA